VKCTVFIRKGAGNFHMCFPSISLLYLITRASARNEQLATNASAHKARLNFRIAVLTNKTRYSQR
jgi:hypothetical protein